MYSINTVVLGLAVLLIIVALIAFTIYNSPVISGLMAGGFAAAGISTLMARAGIGGRGLTGLLPKKNGGGSKAVSSKTKANYKKGPKTHRLYKRFGRKK